MKMGQGTEASHTFHTRFSVVEVKDSSKPSKRNQVNKQIFVKKKIIFNKKKNPRI